VTNPTSGVELYTVVIYPPDWDGEPLPTLVIIPGGTDDSSAIVGGEILRLAHERGFAVVALDPDGRGRSGGEEGYSGFIQQDGLAAVVAFATELPGVDEERMGMLSFSYGVTLASGVLSRYPELPIRFYVDWEGPADRTDTGGCGGDTIGLLNPRAACDDELYWAEREALTFIAQIQVPYQRIQMENDHVQPDVSHAIRMVNAAVEGTSPWVRLNDYVPNQDYDLDAPPAMFPNRGDVSIGERLLDYAEELFEMTEASTSGAEV
jgi:pimeloyl-ACP methyl ester carboxylesterase